MDCGTSHRLDERALVGTPCSREALTSQRRRRIRGHTSSGRKSIVAQLGTLRWEPSARDFVCTLVSKKRSARNHRSVVVSAHRAILFEPPGFAPGLSFPKAVAPCRTNKHVCSGRMGLSRTTPYAIDRWSLTASSSSIVLLAPLPVSRPTPPVTGRATPDSQPECRAC